MSSQIFRSTLIRVDAVSKEKKKNGVKKKMFDLMGFTAVEIR